MLLVPHWTTIFCADAGSSKLMACQSTFSTQSPSMPKFIAFSMTKYFFHINWYHARPTTMVSPNRSILEFVNFSVREWLQWHSIKLDLLKQLVQQKPSKLISNVEEISTKFVKLYYVMPYTVIYCNIKTWLIMKTLL